MQTLPTTIQSFEDIDWITLRKRAEAQKTRERKTASDWDSRAVNFAKRTQHNDYINMLISRLPLAEGTTVLDIGCGPGTLAIPIAQKIGTSGTVTAIDFSEKMLDILRQDAAEQGIENIKTVHLSWEDDWHKAGIVPHDVTLASRSAAVEDISLALQKLNAFATKAVFMTDKISPTPFEPEAFAALDIAFRPAPDYIYTFNILYKMGIYANMEVLEFDQKKRYATMADALASFLWMFDTLTEEQTTQLEIYIRSISTIAADGSLNVHRTTPPRWALLHWRKS